MIDNFQQRPFSQGQLILYGKPSKKNTEHDGWYSKLFYIWQTNKLSFLEKYGGISITMLGAEKLGRPKRRDIKQNTFCVCLRPCSAETNLLANSIFEQKFNKSTNENLESKNKAEILIHMFHIQ